MFLDIILLDLKYLSGLLSLENVASLYAFCIH